jgi:hypothetical protein
MKYYLKFSPFFYLKNTERNSTFIKKKMWRNLFKLTFLIMWSKGVRGGGDNHSYDYEKKRGEKKDYVLFKKKVMV